MKTIGNKPVGPVCCRILGGILVLLVLSAAALAAQEKPAAQMTLKGGAIGDVAFPHQSHEKALKDCNACHSLFPQEKGAIADLQGKGKLKKQQVMNEQCIACHKDNESAGKAAGPTSCSACHNK